MNTNGRFESFCNICQGKQYSLLDFVLVSLYREGTLEELSS